VTRKCYTSAIVQWLTCKQNFIENVWLLPSHHILLPICNNSVVAKTKMCFARCCVVILCSKKKSLSTSFIFINSSPCDEAKSYKSKDDNEAEGVLVQLLTKQYIFCQCGMGMLMLQLWWGMCVEIV